jgi:hypothetical protein
VVGNRTLFKYAFRNISAIPTTPSAPQRWLRIFFLDGAATPLEEVAVTDRFHTTGILATSSDVWHRQRDSGAPMSGGDFAGLTSFTEPKKVTNETEKGLPVGQPFFCLFY